ncbi:cyclase family protein [Corynebacterium felinum]|uniref:Kynurenine formamidase n=1 Tax=Corynebacterium felinum TaxID=131318 RepID=A0ABU2B736_9CORY|nr:cyclase family protein [Corynebacterium felinum]MDF5820201.1 cyclase family protein [Corynebacterium felinum]MDR7354422.1 kynurenine formamidase [Corynebacterium felinum]WJY93792.1 Putative cyclase [Corynebacterium felinum]
MTNLWELVSTLQHHTYVDLTHSFHAGQPRFHLLPDEERETLFTVREHGFEITRYSFVGQWGTHVDPPVHFVDGARTLDNIDVKQMILPLVVLDFTQQVALNPDFTPSISDVQSWEAEHGEIPAGAFVAFRSDWSKRWPDPEKMANKDEQGVAHYPGWNTDLVRWLIDARSITAIGHETTDTDQGIIVSEGALPTELLLLEEDKWQIELLTNLDQVPATGAIIVATWPKPQNGTGFPARAFAIVP